MLCLCMRCATRGYAQSTRLEPRLHEDAKQTRVLGWDRIVGGRWDLHGLCAAKVS